MNNINNDDSETSDTGDVKVENNTIFLYSTINEKLNLDFNTEFHKLKIKLKQQEIAENRPNTSNIIVRINSLGGCIISGLSMMDTIINSDIPVTTVVEGAVASAASFISIVGKKRYITKYSSMMIHQISAFSWGKYDEIKEQVRNLDYFMNIIKSIYIDYTKLNNDKLDEILKYDIYFSPKQCLEYGLVDEILEPGTM